MKVFELTEEELAEKVGRYIRGQRKGLLKGQITWKHCISGGWVKTGSYDHDALRGRGYVVRPGKRWDYQIVIPGWGTPPELIMEKAEQDFFKENEKKGFTNGRKDDSIHSDNNTNQYNSNGGNTMTNAMNIDKNSMIFVEADENSIAVNSATDLKQFSVPDLRKLKKVVGIKVGVANMTKAQVIELIWKELESVPTVKDESKGDVVTPDTKPEDIPAPAPEMRTTADPESETPKKVSKISLLKSAFAEKKTWSRADLLERTEYDQRNLTTALAILKGKRTKEDQRITVAYNREDKTYTIQS